MRKLKSFLWLYLILSFSAAAQMVPANPVTTQQIAMPVFTLNPDPAVGASIQLSGNPGPQTIYYWIAANYLVGNATLAGPFSISNAPNVLSASNYVRISPILPGGATGYDLLKTSTTIPPSGACACAVATGVAVGTVTNDQLNTTGAYTVTVANINALGLTLQNEVQGSGLSHLILRQNGVFVADLSNPLGGGVSFATLLGGTNLGQTFHLGNGSSLDPLNLARLTGNSFWGTVTGPEANSAFTVWSSVDAAGTLIKTHTYGVEYTFVGAVGETPPGTEVQAMPSAGGAYNCTVANDCTITVTAPTIPAQYTGYTAYARDVTNAQSMQQIAGCVNIVGNCTFGSIPATSGPPATNPVMPAPALALPSECPPGTTPFSWIPDSAGNMHSESYISTYYNASTGPPSPGGTRVICRRTWFSDSQVEPVAYKNSFVAINHTQTTGQTAVPTNQDRALSVQAANPSTDTTTTHWGLEALQVEQDLQGSQPNINGSPDGEVSALSVQTSDVHTGANIAPPALGINGVRVTVTKPGTGTIASGGLNGIRTEIADSSTGVSGGSIWYNNLEMLNPKMIGSGLTGVSGSNIHMGPMVNRLPGDNFGLYIENYGSNPLDAAIYATGTASRILTQGPLGFGNTLLTLNGNPTLDSGLSSYGFGTTQLGAPGAIIYTVSPIGTPGATSYTYQVVCKDVNGNTTVGSTTLGTAIGNAILNGSNYNQITISRKAGCWNWDVYRTASGGTPASIGKIGTVAGATQNLLFNGTTAFNDTGLAGDSTTAPTADTTGSLVLSGPLEFVEQADLPVSAAGKDRCSGSSTDHTIKCSLNGDPNGELPLDWDDSGGGVQTGSIGTTTILTPATNKRALFTVSLTQIAAGTGCTTNTTIAVNIIWTDPVAAGSISAVSVTFTIVNNGVANTPILPPTSGTETIYAKAGTPIQYSTTFTGGTCTTTPTYQVQPSVLAW